MFSAIPMVTDIQVPFHFPSRHFEPDGSQRKSYRYRYNGLRFESSDGPDFLPLYVTLTAVSIRFALHYHDLGGLNCRNETCLILPLSEDAHDQLRIALTYSVRRNILEDCPASMAPVVVTSKPHGYAELPYGFSRPGGGHVNSAYDPGCAYLSEWAEQRDDESLYLQASRVVLDFMFDLERSDVFVSCPYYHRIRSSLQRCSYWHAISSKAEYYWQLRQVALDCPRSRSTKTGLGRSASSTYASLSLLACARGQWLDTFSSEWFLKECSKQRTGAQWFVHAEDEVQRVAFDGVSYHALSSRPGYKDVKQSLAESENAAVEWFGRWFLKHYDLDSLLSLFLMRVLPSLSWRSWRGASMAHYVGTVFLVLVAAAVAAPQLAFAWHADLSWVRDIESVLGRLLEMTGGLLSAFGFLLVSVLVFLALRWRKRKQQRRGGLVGARARTGVSRPGQPLPILRYGIGMLLLIAGCFVYLYEAVVTRVPALLKCVDHMVIAAALITFLPPVVLISLLAIRLIRDFVRGGRSPLADFGQLPDRPAGRMAVRSGDLATLLLSMFLPRMLLAISAAWLVMASSDRAIGIISAMPWPHMLACNAALLAVTGVFTIVEINKRLRRPSRAFLRAIGLLLVAYCLAIWTGAFFLSLSADHMPVDSAPPATRGVGYSVGPIFPLRSPSAKVAEVLTELPDEEQVVMGQRAHPLSRPRANQMGHASDRLFIPVHYEWQVPFVKWQVPIYPRAILVGSVIAVFAGLSLTLITDDRAITEPL